MCRTPALAATVLALLATPALAAEPGKTQLTAAPLPAAAPTVRTRATAPQRLEAGRMDPLARAAFWGREMEIDPRDAEAAVGLSRALRQLDRNDEAADVAGRGLVAAPDNVDLLMESARAWVAKGQGFYAIEPARKAQALSPRDWRPLAVLAVAMEQTDRDAEALGYHNQAYALAPNEPGVISNLAMYHATHGDLARAEQMLRVATASGRADARVRQNLVMVLGLQGRIAEAEALARQDLPPDQVANNVAWLKAATERAPTGQGRSWDSVTGGR